MKSITLLPSDIEYVDVNNKFCELAGPQKFPLERKSYREIIHAQMNIFFDAIEKYQSELINPIAIKGISKFNFSLNDGKEIIEIQVIDKNRKIIALVGFSRDTPSSLPINNSGINGAIFGDIISFLPVPSAVIKNYAKIKLCNQEFCKLIKKNSEDILNSDLISLFPRGLCDAISDFAKNGSDGIIIELNESLEVIPELGNGYH